MSDQKFLNKVKEFAHSLDHKYEIEKFKLKESYSESILVKAYIGGSRGGDCWGGHTCQYEENDRDIVDSLVSSVRYTVMSYFSDYVMVVPQEVIKEHMSNYSRYDYISQTSESSDYYGNYTDEGIYEVPIYPLMKKLLDDEHFQIFKSYLSNEKNKLNKVFTDRKVSQRIEELTEKINSFESDKKKELSNLKDNIERYENILKSLKEDLKNFTPKKVKDLKSLQDELMKLKTTI